MTKVSALVVLMVTVAQPGVAQILHSQLPSGGSAWLSQDAPDQPENSTFEFDDFVVPAGREWELHTAQFYGVNDLVNNGVAANGFMTIQASPGYQTDMYVQISDILQYVMFGSDLIFNFVWTLPAGHYWISAWVQKPVLPDGGQWNWKATTHVTGSPAYVHNPGGGLLGSSAIMPLYTVTGRYEDMAFALAGVDRPVPEPSTAAMLAALGALGFVRRRSLAQQHRWQNGKMG